MNCYYYYAITVMYLLIDLYTNTHPNHSVIVEYLMEMTDYICV